jgi:hypothetical protein
LSELGVSDLGSRGEFEKKIKELALQQLTEVVARTVYNEKSPESPGLRNNDVEGKNFDEMAEALSIRLTRIQADVQGFDASTWKDEFVQECQQKHQELTPTWNESWIKYASGKRLIDDLYKNYKINISKLALKRKLAKRILVNKSEDWTLVKSKIIDALG